MRRSLREGIRVFLLFSLLSLCSCSRFSKHSCWVLAETRTDHLCYNSGKLFLSSKKSLCPMELEVSRGHCGTRMYLNLTTYLAKPFEKDPSKTEVVVFYGGCSQVVLATLFAGGQRILLPDPVADDLIETLWRREEVSFQMGMLKTTFPAQGFRSGYAKLLRIPID